MKKFKINKEFELISIAPFVPYEIFRKHNPDQTCFKYGHKFLSFEQTYLGGIKCIGNKLFCDKCYNKLKDDTKK